jgi:FKBP12-rapamycin complex-associated protein
MSMVGYILGLGDRHPSNLMIDQVTGRVVHIDFGDCFEVAMQREKFPERVPFRLTRMLIKAMEVSGIEGSFRITCEHAMRVLRSNKDSLMAVLEAFVYDPLINWRLLTRSTAGAMADPAGRSGVSQGGGASFANGFANLNLSRTSATAMAASGGALSPTNTDDFLYFPDNFSSSRRIRRDTEIARLEEESINRPEAVNAGALNVISRVSNKLLGRDFAGAAAAPSSMISPSWGPSPPVSSTSGTSATMTTSPPTSPLSPTGPLEVATQVDRLIQEATKVENLCRAYVGWCAFW